MVIMAASGRQTHWGPAGPKYDVLQRWMELPSNHDSSQGQEKRRLPRKCTMIETAQELCRQMSLKPHGQGKYLAPDHGGSLLCVHDWPCIPGIYGHACGIRLEKPQGEAQALLNALIDIPMGSCCLVETCCMNADRSVIAVPKQPPPFPPWPPCFLNIPVTP